MNKHGLDFFPRVTISLINPEILMALAGGW